MSHSFPSHSHSVIPAEVQRDGGRLLDLAMWCLGRDVRHPAGNLLLRWGCLREALPEGQRGTSAYSCALPGRATLTLWGFGALVRPPGDATAVFFGRDLLRPQLAELTPAAWPLFQTAGLGELRAPSTPWEVRLARLGAAALAAWLAEYEAWVRGTLGPEYRASLLALRNKSSPCSADALSEAWQRLATRLLSLTEMPPEPLDLGAVPPHLAADPMPHANRVALQLIPSRRPPPKGARSSEPAVSAEGES